MMTELFNQNKKVDNMGKILHKINSKYIYLAVVIIVGIVIFLLNFFTPLTADDYDRVILFGTFEDFLNSNLNLYYNWGGRNIALSISQFFLTVNKNYFNIMNTLVYILLVYLIYKHITNEKYNTTLFVIINLALWVIVPAWGQNILWITGSTAYLWTTVYCLLFLLPFRYSFADENYKLNKILTIGMFFLGILAGWSLENSAAALLFILIVYVAKKIVKREKFKLFEILGIIGFIIGFGLLLLAPGNYVRADNFVIGSLLYEILKRFISITTNIFEYFILFIIVFFFLFIELLKQKKIKNGILSYVYLLAGLASLYSMIFSPIFPDRTYFISVIFFTISVYSLAKHVVFDRQIIRFYMLSFALITFLYFPVTLYNASRNIVGTYIKLNNRIEYIYEQKEKGIYKIEVAPIPVYDKHVALYGLIDLTTNANDWPNTSIANYFGIEEIKIKNE